MKSKIIFCLIIIFVLSARLVLAAELELLAPNAAAAGQTFSLEVNLSQPNEPVNAISGSLVFKPEAFKFESIADGGSVVNLWIKKPELVKNGRIDFAGVTPGGLLPGNLFKVNLTPLTSGPEDLALEEVKLFANDGTGKSFAVPAVSTALNVLPADSKVLSANVIPADITPPAPFTIQVVRDPAIFNNLWFAVFNTTDSQSGLDHYEVAESLSDKQDSLAWEKTASPYLLKDQDRKSFLFVKAVDRAGNARLSVLNPNLSAKKSLDSRLKYGIIVLLFFLLGIFWLVFKKQNVKKN